MDWIPVARKALLAVLIVYYWMVATFASFVAYGSGYFRCEECYDGEEGIRWTLRREAWQWDALQALGVASFLLATVLALLLTRYKGRAAKALFVLETSLLVVIWLFLSSPGIRIASVYVLIAVTGLAAGGYAVWVSSARRASGSAG